MIDTDEAWEEEEMSNLGCESVRDLIEEVKRLREKLAEVEYRLEMAEDVLGRSDWNTIYREIIDEVIE
jgi:hypothetical protein